MKKTKPKPSWKRRLIAAPIVLFAALYPLIAFAEDAAEGDGYQSAMYMTFWSLVPPLIAIVLALITKEVYSSLFIGIVVGGLFYADFSPEGAFLEVFNKGFVGSLTDPWNVGIIIFLAVLGAMVSLMNRAGGSAAFGRWARTNIKSRTGAQIAVIILGILIFIDDYFNCLTVGSVMRPVTDPHNISRAKLAYLIDSTAAPVCIIAPISSWAAAVSGFVEGEDGFMVFVRTIPYNFYAILTLVFLFGLVLLKVDFGPMRKHERNAVQGDIYTTPDRPYAANEEIADDGKGKLIDLILPILLLIVGCVIGMIYTGGFFSGNGFVDSFSDSDASVGLMLGSASALIVTIIVLSVRRALPFKVCMEALPDGVKAMVPAILILTMAWTLKTMTGDLGADVFVSDLMEGSAEGLQNMLPAGIFLVAVGLAFSTGTSWGTFGILIPLVVEVFAETDPKLLIIGMAACMAGGVVGDHCSPISDTTIMASAGAQCNHVNHVSTQLPYALLVAAVSFVGFVVAGLVRTPIPSLLLGAALVVGLLFVLRKKYGAVAEEQPETQQRGVG
ncbi:MAG: Na+/H+ antiporter NhaC family protein [Clostridiales Family XIII bacterium]|jgi:Na+/H+ antiporter NhaC|nr:Na+/H+ antiporter NhaC family protein [Clostridiales Family XIII bacterium]